MIDDWGVLKSSFECQNSIRVDTMGTSVASYVSYAAIVVKLVFKGTGTSTVNSVTLDFTGGGTTSGVFAMYNLIGQSKKGSDTFDFGVNTCEGGSESNLSTAPAMPFSWIGIESTTLTLEYPGSATITPNQEAYVNIFLWTTDTSPKDVTFRPSTDSNCTVTMDGHAMDQDTLLINYTPDWY